MRRIVDTSDPVNWSHPLNRGLVSWWLALPGQQRGVIWRDLCRRNNGTLTNGPKWNGARGRPGGWGCLDFSDESNHYVNTGSTLGGIKAPLTISAWIAPDETVVTITHYIIGHRGSPSNNTGFSFQWAAAGNEVISCSIFGVKAVNSTINLNSVFGDWSHVAVTYDQVKMRFYLNGRLIDDLSETSLITASTREVVIGGLNNQGTMIGGFDGRIDDLRVYNLIVSPSGINELFTLSRQGYPGLLNRLPTRRYAPEQAVAGGLSIPIAAYHYNHHLGSMA